MADRGDRGGRGRGRARGDRGDRGGRGRGADRGGDSGSRGRGSSDRGDRGSRGRGSGDGGRGRGGDRGDRGGRGRGTDRGGYVPRGDRGGFQGGFGGYRGDGPRGGRGGRGGGRGGRREESPGKTKAFSYDGLPTPDSEITELENRLVLRQASSLASLTSQMGSLGVKGAGSKSLVIMSDQFPARPAFGSAGKPVVVWANYFRVNVTPDIFFKYHLEVSEIARVEEETPEGSKGAEEAGESAGGFKTQVKEVKGRKLYLVIRETIAQLLAHDKTLVAASEFKSQLITMKILELPSNPLRIELARSGSSERKDTFEVKFHGPFEAQLDVLKHYLTSMGNALDATVFPRYPEIIDALDVILGYGPRKRLDAISAVGSSRFFSFGQDKVVHELAHNWHALTAARGYFQSARIGTGRLLLNANITHGIFKISGPVRQIFDNLRIRAIPRTDRGMRMLKAFSKFLPSTRVWAAFTTATGHNVRRSKTIRGLAMASAVARRGSGLPKFDNGWEFAGPKNVQFFWKDGDSPGRYITVFEYYRIKYGIILEDYPLLDLGKEGNHSYFPAEVLEIQPGQSVKAKLTMDETTAMLEFACRSPYSNALSISTASRQVLDLDDGELDKFGVQVEKRLLTVSARILRAPTVSYLNDKQKTQDVTPRFGAWNMRDVKVYKPGKMFQRWTWVNVLLRGNERKVESDIVYQYGEFLHKMGIAINKKPITPPTDVLDGRLDANDMDKFFQWLQENEVQLVVIILSDKDSTGVYSKIKTLGDCTYGVHTSCVVAKQFGKAHPAYFANVGLKVNLKGGGVNHKLRDEFGVLKDGKTMLVGYDVTHPTNMPVKKDKIPPSLVGLVASIDGDFAQWPAVTWEQTSGQEMLSENLVDAFVSRLELWQKHNRGNYPENIVIFRDGVSEGQFALVLDHELPSIREACEKKYPATSQPRITIVVAVKRHQTRFYPTKEAEMSRSGNIMNGTVVDRGVTQVRYWDFFLTAHDALQGTARPAHYTVLLDEIFRSKYGKEAANELERLTHELCYLFGRATKAVSICPPAYYADIVCDRARAHRPEWFEMSDTESVTTSASMSTAIPGGKPIHESLKDSMYYI